MPSHTWKRNDTNPISGTLKAGSPLAAVDLQGATLRFHMEKRDGTVIIDAAGNVDQVGDGSDGSKGNWSYDPIPADTDEAGQFWAEVEVTFAGGVVQTFPNTGYFDVYINEDLQ